jgi:hypothetical protein
VLEFGCAAKGDAAGLNLMDGVIQEACDGRAGELSIAHPLHELRPEIDSISSRVGSSFGEEAWN